MKLFKKKDFTEENKKEIERSEARRCKEVFKKYKKLIKKRMERASFQEPVLLLIRRSSHIEFYENATKGEFVYDHSDGKKRYIILDPKGMKTFDYGNETFKGYICHEDFPTPVPEDPVMTTEMFAIAQEKALFDINKMKAEQTKATTEMFWKVLIGIAIVIIAFAVYKTMVPSQAPAQAVRSVVGATQVAINNATIIR